MAVLGAACSSTSQTDPPDAAPPDASTPDTRPPDTSTGGNGDAPRSAPGPAPARQGWQETGALALFKPRTLRSLRAAALTADQADGGETPDAGPGPGEWIEISAPVFPKVLTLYMGEGDNYPSTQEGRERLVHDSALTFEALLEHCAPMNPAIKRRQPGDPPLGEAEIMANYDAIAECAYTEFTAKPYWIPQLVSDVDICGQELGPNWRLITQADIDRLTDADLVRVQAWLDATAGGFGGFYFSLRVFARAGDGSIQEGRLEPGVQPRLVPLMYQNAWSARNHYEGGLALRCLRTTEVIE